MVLGFDFRPATDLPAGAEVPDMQRVIGASGSRKLLSIRGECDRSPTALERSRPVRRLEGLSGPRSFAKRLQIPDVDMTVLVDGGNTLAVAGKGATDCRFIRLKSVELLSLSDVPQHNLAMSGVMGYQLSVRGEFSETGTIGGIAILLWSKLHHRGRRQRERQTAIRRRLRA
jgi:hypothetical protein